MSRILLSFLVFCLCLPLNALAEVKGKEEAKEKAKSTEYRLQKDDALRMTVYQEEELGTETQIGKSGFVSFPLIGSVKVLGLTVKEAEEAVRVLYEKDYLVSAKVNLAVLSYSKKWVVVGGEVRRPGTIEYPEEGSLDLRGAIAQAGGLMETANESSITLRRKSGATSTHSLAGSGGITLKHGDMLTVNRTAMSQSSVTVSGQVNRPGIVAFPKRGGLSLVTAIAQAGGFSRIANRKNVTVRRNGRAHLIDYRVIAAGKETFSLRAGDIIIVKESIW